MTEIGHSILCQMNTITEVVLPHQLKIIGGSAFQGCVNLPAINLPDTLAEIGSTAFGGCTSLASIVIPEGGTALEWSNFSHCSSLTTIDIPDTVTTLGCQAFCYCDALESIRIPAGVVTVVGSGAATVTASCGDVKAEMITTVRTAECTGHNAAPYEDVEVTCTTDGRTGCEYCTVCGSAAGLFTICSGLELRGKLWYYRKKKFALSGDRKEGNGMKKLCCAVLAMLLILCCASALAEQCKYYNADSPCEPGWWLDLENKRHARACFYHVEDKEDVNSHVLITPWEDCTPDEGGVCTGCGHDYDTSDEEPSYDDYDMYMMEAFFYYREMYGASPVEVTEENGKMTITFKDDFFTFMDEMGFPYGESAMVGTDLTLDEVGGVWTVEVSEYGAGAWLQRMGMLEIGSVSESGAEITIDGVTHTLGGSVGGDDPDRCKYYQADSPCNIIWWLDKENMQHCRACKNHVEDKEDPFSYVRVTEWTDCTPGEDYICTGCGWDYSPAQGPTEEDYDAYMVEIYYKLLEKKGVPPMDVTVSGDTLTIKLNEQFQMYMLEYGIPVTETLMVGTEYTLTQSGGEWTVEPSEYGPGAWLQRMSLIGISDVQVSGGKVTAEIALDGGETYTLTVGSVSPVILPGDADGDGEVGIMDALAILQAAVGWDVHVDQDASDVDGSGEVDIMDALRILQYSVGWDVELL